MLNATAVTTKATTGTYSNLSINGLCDNAIASSHTHTLCVGYGVDQVSIEMTDLKEAVDKLTKTPEVAVETTTKLNIQNGKIKVKHYKDGFFDSERFVISDIKDVKVHGNTVIVIFADDTKTVAVLDSEDDFSLEQGISICITKKLLGKDGSSVYNKLINRALKVKEQNEKVAQDAQKAKEEEKSRRKLALKRHQKKLAKKREAEIEMRKEAYIRAIEYINAGIDSEK